MSKKLMNEQLPTPVSAGADSPRERVLGRMRDALAAGASVALLTGCPFGVVDPLPPPAQCRMRTPDQLITATATAESTDSGPLRVRVTLTSPYDSGLETDLGAVVTGGTLISQTSDESIVELAPGGTTFSIALQVTCNDYRTPATHLGVKVTVTLNASGAPTAVVSNN